MFESCVEIRAHLYDYLEGACEPAVYRSARFHLRYCRACSDELERYRVLQADLRALPRPRVPPQLALRLRVRLSQEIHRNLLSRLSVRLENALRPMLLPASSGVLVAIIAFGLIMGSNVVPVSPTPDVPVSLVTPPRVRTLAPIDINTGDQPLILVTYIDAEGRVTNYRILSGAQTPEVTERLDRIMYFSLFQPATMFGRPTDGRMILSLRRITIRG